MLEGGGDEFLDGGAARIEAQRIGRAGERGMAPLLVQVVALADDIVFALLLAALGAHLGVGIEEEFVGRLRKDDSADVAPFHDERRLGGEALLLGDEKLADGGNLRDVGNAFVDFGFADVRERIEASDEKSEFAVAEGGLDSRRSRWRGRPRRRPGAGPGVAGGTR